MTSDTLGDIGSCVIPTDLEDNVLQLHKFLFGEDSAYTPSSTVIAISADIASQSSLTYGEYTDDSLEYGETYYYDTYYDQSYDTSDSYYDDGTYDDGTYDDGSGGDTGGYYDDTGEGY